VLENENSSRRLNAGHQSNDNPIACIHQTFAVVKIAYCGAFCGILLAPPYCGEEGTRKVMRSLTFNRRLVKVADPVPTTPGNNPIAIEHVVSALTSINAVVGKKGCAAPLEAADTMTEYSVVEGTGMTATAPSFACVAASPGTSQT
jgi:hypothetical protein